MTRILLVDDHAAVRRAVGEVLREGMAGAEIAEAATADEATHLAAAATLDLAIVDLALGGRGGLETLRDLRDLRPDLPVLVMSMHPEAMYGPAARAAGATGYLVKGSGPELIVGAARRAIDDARAGAPASVTATGAAVSAPLHERAGGRASPELPRPEDLEEERRRLARCLHDEVGQALAVAKINLGLAAAAAAPDEIHRHAAEASAVVGQAIDSLRRVVSRLRPPLLDELGLVPAVRALLAVIAAERGSAGGAPTLEAPAALEAARAAPDLEIAAFRAVERGVRDVIDEAPAEPPRVVLRPDAGWLYIAVVGGDSARHFELAYPPAGGER